MPTYGGVDYAGAPYAGASSGTSPIATAESGEQLMRRIQEFSGDTFVQNALYALAEANPDLVMEQLQQLYLVSQGRGTQIRESLVATIAAGGGTGDTSEKELLQTGLTGWQ